MSSITVACQTEKRLLRILVDENLGLLALLFTSYNPQNPMTAFADG